MKTPIADFVREYADKKTARFHMPGHKGVPYLGCERYDITEIDGADVLYSPESIILESENNASRLFGTAHTYYSTEGSSLCIKAMLALVAQGSAGRPRVLAARNIHKAFVYACALLDLDVDWIYPEGVGHLCECRVTPQELDAALKGAVKKPCAVYVTSPDYLGNILDIKGLSEVCHTHGVPLLVDNAHGAYLRFCEGSDHKIAHPIALGADMCCDSAHKTLPVLTGGAYLHIAPHAEKYCSSARQMLSLFASTSPSYLILQSLDTCNSYLSGGYKDRLSTLCEYVLRMKKALADKGFSLIGDEPLKITLNASGINCSGEEISLHLRERGIEVEFSDNDVCVMMLTPENTEDELCRLERALCDFDISKHKVDTERDATACATLPERKMSIRRAILSNAETIPTDQAQGRVCADPCVSCPPAVPVVVSGEIIGREQIRLLKKHGKDKISVVK